MQNGFSHDAAHIGFVFAGQGKTPTDFCTDRLLEAFMAFINENKHSKLMVYLVNNEQRKTDKIKKVMLSFLGLQTALRQSKQSQQIQPNPQQRTRSPDVGGHRRPTTNLSRSQTDRHPQGRQREVNKMSSTFTSMTVGSGDSSAGGSRFYDDDDDDDYDDDKDSQGPSLVNMSLVVRKPVFRVSDQVPHKQRCTTTQDG